MQKICIVTWYKSDNYGTELQAAALTHYLKGMGLDVYMLKRFKVLPMLFRHPQLLKTKIEVKLNEKKRKEFFHPVEYTISEERKAHIAEFVKDNFQELDIDSMDKWKEVVADKMIFITGSDIIWQPAMGRPGRMFLDFAAYDGLTRISYASSTGAKTMPQKFEKDYKRLLGGFKAVSTREQNSADYFSQLLGRDVVKVIDPTLLHEKEFWDGFSQKAKLDGVIQKKYIFCYFVMEDPRYHSYVKMVAAQYPDHQLIILPMHHSDEREEYTVVTNGTAYEFISLIKNSDFVLTDSFHAAVFSFTFDKEFYVLKRARSDEDEKFKDLVTRYGLTNRIITDETQFTRDADTNYTKGKETLRSDRQKSREFLQNAIGTSRKTGETA